METKHTPGMNHNSPILSTGQTGGRVDPAASLAELKRRCAKCAARGSEPNQ